MKISGQGLLDSQSSGSQLSFDYCFISLKAHLRFGDPHKINASQGTFGSAGGQTSACVGEVAQSCPTLCSPMDCTVHGILQAEYWSGQPFPSLGDLLNPGIEPRSLALHADSLPAEPQGSPCSFEVEFKTKILEGSTEIPISSFPKSPLLP